MTTATESRRMLQDRRYHSTMRAHHRLTGDQTLAFTAGADVPRSVSVTRSLPKNALDLRLCALDLRLCALDLRLEELQHFAHDGGALHRTTVAVVFSLVTSRTS